MNKNIAKLAKTDPGLIIKLGGLDTSTLKKLGSVFDDMEAELEAVKAELKLYKPLPEDTQTNV